MSAWYLLAGAIVAHHVLIHPDLPWPDRVFQLDDAFNLRAHEFYALTACALAVLTPRHKRRV